MEGFNTYRAQGLTTGLVFVFKYDLNGDFRHFEVVEGVLTDEQMKWLYSGIFPASEALMQKNWVDNPSFRTKFDITLSPADISFNAMWELYGYKVGKADAEKAYKKLKEADIIKAFRAIPNYNKFAASKPHQEKLHLSTFIGPKRRFEDEWQVSPPKQATSKNYNQAINDIASQKTIK